MHYRAHRAIPPQKINLGTVILYSICLSLLAVMFFKVLPRAIDIELTIAEDKARQYKQQPP